jgi:tryptophan synthase
MGYYNPFLNYGESALMKDCQASGVNGFIFVDLPPEEAVRFRDCCSEFGLSYVPLITPSTSESRMKRLVTVASSFIYVVSTLGVTGARESVNSDLPAFLERIKKHTNLPLAVGFGVSTREHFLSVGAHAEGVVIGSKIITIIKEAPALERAQKVKEFAQSVTGRVDNELLNMSEIATALTAVEPQFDAQTHLLPARFGQFGGQYAPEALVDCLEEIELAFRDAIADPLFKKEVESYYPYTNRPSNCHLAERLTEDCGGARIWLKREDLNHVCTSNHRLEVTRLTMLWAKFSLQSGWERSAL